MARYKKNTTPKLTLELIEEISLAIRSGVFMESACALCGISKDTLYRWLREAKKEEASDILKQLSYAISRSLAEDEFNHLQNIGRAAMGVPKKYELDDSGNVKVDEFGNPVVLEYFIKPNWRASAYRLSRRNPKRWGANGVGDTAALLLDSPIEEEDCSEDIIQYVDLDENGKLCTYSFEEL